MAQRQKKAELKSISAAIRNHVLPCRIPLIRVPILKIIHSFPLHNAPVVPRLPPSDDRRPTLPGCGEPYRPASAADTSGRSTTTVQMPDVHLSPALLRLTDKVCSASTGFSVRSRKP